MFRKKYLERRLENLEITIYMMTLFEQIRSTHYSDRDREIMSKMPIEGIPEMTYLDELDSILTSASHVMHKSFYHQDFADVWEKIAGNYWATQGGQKQ